MPSTATGPMTITFPNDLSISVREKVASGEYPSEDAVVFDILHDYFDPQWQSDEWILREVLPVMDAMDADPSRGRSVEQVRASLAERHMQKTQAGQNVPR